MLTPRLSQIVSMRHHSKIVKSRGNALLGADVALSSEQLLNVGARGIEDGGEVSGRHLDCVSLVDVTTGERGQGSGVGDIFLGRASCGRRSLRFWHTTEIQFCGEPRQGCAIGDDALTGRYQLLAPSPDSRTEFKPPFCRPSVFQKD
jgi:hypothetical protein